MEEARSRLVPGLAVHSSFAFFFTSSAGINCKGRSAVWLFYSQRLHAFLMKSPVSRCEGFSLVVEESTCVPQDRFPDAEEHYVTF